MLLLSQTVAGQFRLSDELNRRLNNIARLNVFDHPSESADEFTADIFDLQSIDFTLSLFELTRIQK